MEFLQSLLENSHTPIVTAFLLGILTAFSPCPLATNITAIGYIGKEIESRHRIFTSGILYTVGRIITYTVLGSILIPILRQGASMFAIQKTIAEYGDLFLAPVLILIGLFMLFGHKLNLPKFGFNAGGINRWMRKDLCGALLLGILFSLAFCPTSALFYFGMLMPVAAAETGGYLLPVVFAIATGLPVVVVAWILAYSVSKLGKFYHRVRQFQQWMNKIIALLFIAVGIYYAAILYI